jgi:NADPH-dependent glutamate synthase beta subunit-like oxidoreductase
MPRDELEAEIHRIENLGVKITLNHRVDDVLAEKDEGGFDAVFVAVGAHISKKIDIPNQDAACATPPYLGRGASGQRPVSCLW